MAHLIDKSALTAEIERRIKSLHQVNSPREQAVLYECKDILSFINTLEVKEVNLGKEIEDYFKGWSEDKDNGAACHYQYVDLQDCKAIAKHFFELGLKAQKGE